jgi:hypothetical protein
MSSRVHRLLDHGVLHYDVCPLSKVGITNYQVVFDDRNVNVKSYCDTFSPIGLTDPAVFHQALANLAIYLQRVRHLPEAEAYQSQEALFHQMEALKLVIKKITNKRESTSEGVIGTIIGLACNTVSSYKPTQ